MGFKTCVRRCDLIKDERTFRTYWNLFRSDSKIEETLFFSSPVAYRRFRKSNILLSLSVLVPIISNLWDLNVPNLIGYCIFAFLVYLILFFEEVTGTPILEEIKMLSTVQFALHSVFGIWLEFYNKINWFDDFLHILGGFWGAVGLYPIILGIELVAVGKGSKTLYLKVNLFVLAIMNTFGVMWETSEFVSDQIFGHQERYRLAQENCVIDTIMDLILNNTGTVLGIICFALYLKYSRDLTDIFIITGTALRKFFRKFVLFSK